MTPTSALRLLLLLRSEHPDTKVDPAVARSVIASYLAANDADQQQAIDDQLRRTVRHVISGGWTPSDLYEVTRRRLLTGTVTHLMSCVADETARHSSSATHPDWLGQLAQLNAAPAVGGSRGWAQRERLPWSEAHEELIALLVLMTRLPRLEPVLPPPGTARSSCFAEAHVDEGVLRKVRGLLAKAEATGFEAEAEALTAKAQQLMTRHAIDSALASSSDTHKRAPQLRRVWLDPPYVDSKVVLVEAVASANHCRCLFAKGWDYVSLVGYDTDLDTVDLLVTSLLVQATRAMTAMGSQTSRSGVSKTRSYRRSFLMSFAVRIGERLQDVASEMEDEADVAHGGDLLPVLAARDGAVEDEMTRLFPKVETRFMSFSNRSGWSAGRAAADLARLNVRDAVEPG